MSENPQQITPEAVAEQEEHNRKSRETVRVFGGGIAVDMPRLIWDEVVVKYATPGRPIYPAPSGDGLPTPPDHAA